VVTLGVRPEGHITIELRNADGVQTREFDNVVLDSGWDSLISRMLTADAAAVPKWLYFGIGESEPSKSDSGLEQRLTNGKAHTSIAYSGLVNAGNLTAYSQAIVRFDYAPGELSGVRWTEVGLAYGNSYVEPYNRALIMDEARVPTPLVCLADQTVTVYVRLRLWLTGWGSRVETGIVSGTLNLNGNIQSTTNGLWIKGFPLNSAVLGSLAPLAREGYAPPSSRWYFVTNADNFSASFIAFRARSDIEMLRIDLDNDKWITKPNGWALHFRIGITIVRGAEPSGE
jgi:hypothetical protein